MTDTERLINMHETRVHTANNHPRNSFFMQVQKDSLEKLKMLRGQIPNPIIECDDCDWKDQKAKLTLTRQCPNCNSISTLSK